MTGGALAEKPLYGFREFADELFNVRWLRLFSMINMRRRLRSSKYSFKRRKYAV